MEIPDKTVRKINNSAFGPAGMGMREILGYAPIQPDGSVQIQVPANVPFTIDIVDVNAKRRHRPAHQLAAAAARRNQDLQRLSHHGQHDLRTAVPV